MLPLASEAVQVAYANGGAAVLVAVVALLGTVITLIFQNRNTRREMSATKADISKVAAQFQPNGGSSARDAWDRVERGMSALAKENAAIRADVSGLRAEVLADRRRGDDNVARLDRTQADDRHALHDALSDVVETQRQISEVLGALPCSSRGPGISC